MQVYRTALETGHLLPIVMSKKHTGLPRPMASSTKGSAMMHTREGKGTRRGSPQKGRFRPVKLDLSHVNNKYNGSQRKPPDLAVATTSS